MFRTAAAMLAALLTLALAACNPAANMSEAGDQIDRYQYHFSFAEMDDMYAMTSPAFRKSTSREDFDGFVEVIADRLGPIETSERIGFNVNTTPAGTTTVLTMETQFEKGVGTEIYTFVGSGEDMKIQGWNVNSDRLLLSADDLETLRQAEESKSSEKD